MLVNHFFNYKSNYVVSLCFPRKIIYRLFCEIVISVIITFPFIYHISVVFCLTYFLSYGFPWYTKGFETYFTTLELTFNVQYYSITFSLSV